MKRLYTLLIAITAISPAITATAATAADTVIDATTVNRVIIAESNHAATITLDGMGRHRALFGPVHIFCAARR